MKVKYIELAYGPARLLLIAICLVLVLILPTVQALHYHALSGGSDRCSTCQAINSTTQALPRVVLWAVLAAMTFVAWTTELIPIHHIDPFYLFSRPPPLP
jgi:hypothetical protein